MRILCYLWALPATSLGLLVGLGGLVTGSKFQVRKGVLEIWGGFADTILDMGIPGIGEMPAMTLGHVIIARDKRLLRRWRTHERVHVEQFERLGPFLIPTLFGWAIWLSLTGRDPYYDNPIELEAYGRVPFPHEVATRPRRRKVVARAGKFAGRSIRPKTA